MVKHKVMKENAPEKSYLHPTAKGNVGASWLTFPLTDNDIEYTRTDAFVEKACAFFEENIEEEDCKIGSSEWVELRAEYKSLDSFIRAFVRYMKGE